MRMLIVCMSHLNSRTRGLLNFRHSLATILHRSLRGSDVRERLLEHVRQLPIATWSIRCTTSLVYVKSLDYNLWSFNMHLTRKLEVSTCFHLCQRKNKETKNHICPLKYQHPLDQPISLVEPFLFKGKMKRKRSAFCSIELYGRETRQYSGLALSCIWYGRWQSYSYLLTHLRLRMIKVFQTCSSCR
jgi:hypothetical protein